MLNWELVERRYCECASKLSCAVGTEVEKDYSVSIQDLCRWRARTIDNNDRLNKFISDAAFVRSPYSSNRIGSPFSLRFNQQVIRSLCSLPPFVAIHCVIAPND